MLNFNDKTEVIKMIVRIDDCLAENKIIIDQNAGKTREELGDHMFDTCNEIAELSVRLMIARYHLVDALRRLHGITMI